MGSLKLEQRQKVESDQGRDLEIQEVGEQKIEEAETSAQALEQIEAIDDDDKAAVDAARSESDGIAKALAESEIKEPGSDVGESLKETSEQSTEYSETEMTDAEKASEMTGDFSETGAELSESLQESGQEFQDIAEESDQVNDEMQSKFEQMAAELEGVF